MYSASVFAYASSCLCALFTFLLFALVAFSSYCVLAVSKPLRAIFTRAWALKLFFHLFLLGEGGECYIFRGLLKFIVYGFDVI